MIKTALTYLRDVALSAVLVGLIFFGIYGVKLPFRKDVLNSGPYQIEAFPTGLAWYQFGRVSPFYSMSPKHDFWTTATATESALLSGYVEVKQTHWQQIYTVVRSFFTASRPEYEATNHVGSRVRYEAYAMADGGVKIQRVISFSQPVQVEDETMTLSYNASDEVTMSGTKVIITNPTIAGVLEILTTPSQHITINSQDQLIMITSLVQAKVNTLTMSVLMKGER